jgi:hypothetical protein
MMDRADAAPLSAVTRSPTVNAIRAKAKATVPAAQEIARFAASKLRGTGSRT